MRNSDVEKTIKEYQFCVFELNKVLAEKMKRNLGILREDDCKDFRGQVAVFNSICKTGVKVSESPEDFCARLKLSYEACEFALNKLFNYVSSMYFEISARHSVLFTRPQGPSVAPDAATSTLPTSTVSSQTPRPPGI